MIPLPWLSILRYVLPVIGVAGLVWWAHHTVWDNGYASCQAEWNQATAEAMIARDAELDVARLRGEALSKGLAEKERELSALNREYLTYASAITGHCPASLGVLVGTAAAGQTLPGTPGPSPDPAATVGAASIAANIATNYPRCWECIARLNALLDWHAGAKDSVTKKKEE